METISALGSPTTMNHINNSDSDYQLDKDNTS